MKEKKHKRWIYLLAAGTMTMLSMSCQKEGSGSSPFSRSETEANREVDKSYNVRTAEVYSGRLDNYLDLSGEIQPASTVDVYPDTTGKLSSMSVHVGDYVRKDQQLALVDPSRPGMNYAASPVTAPVSGTVTAINADEGATLSPQMPLLRIGQLDQLQIKAQVPERFISQIELGQSAQVGSTAYAGQLYSARVSEISPVINPASRTMEITLSLEEESPLKAGMFLGLRLTISTQDDALLIPEEALIERSGRYWVFRVNQGMAEKVEIQIGPASSGLISIREGLNPGDEVVIEGKSLLSDGSNVRVINDMSLQELLPANQS